MSLEAGLYTLLSGTAGVAALVGTRIYPVVAPQNATLRRITYFRVTDTPGYVFSTAAPKTGEPLFQVSCWGASYASAKAVAEAVKAVLGAYTSGTVGGVSVLAMYLEDERDLPSKPTPASTTWPSRCG